jgi:hypothetical protein
MNLNQIEEMIRANGVKGTLQSIANVCRQKGCQTSDGILSERWIKTAKKIEQVAITIKNN